MGYLIGRGRYKSETYPSPKASAASAAEFASLVGNDVTVPGDDTVSDIGAPGIEYTSVTGTVRVIATIVGTEENATDPAAGTVAVTVSVTLDGSPLGNAYGATSYPAAVGISPNIPAITLTFVSVEAVGTAPHTYSVICQCKAPTSAPADGLQVQRSILTIEDVPA